MHFLISCMIYVKDISVLKYPFLYCGAGHIVAFYETPVCAKASSLYHIPVQFTKNIETL